MTTFTYQDRETEIERLQVELKAARRMQHIHSDYRRSAAGRYREAFTWHRHIGHFLESIITETPLLHVCSGPVSDFGDVRCDRYVVPRSPGVVADWVALPFGDDKFAAVFADPPWKIGQMKSCADFCHEALRVAPVAYVMAPWLWVHERARRSKIWVRDMPGVNIPVLIARYERKNKDQMALFNNQRMQGR